MGDWGYGPLSTGRTPPTLAGAASIEGKGETGSSAHSLEPRLTRLTQIASAFFKLYHSLLP